MSVDQWSTTTTSNGAIRAFLVWANEHGHARALTVAQRPQELSLASVDDDERWALAKRLLHDDSIHTVDRVAGILVLLYAQPLTRITRLTVDHVHDDGTELHLTLARHQVLMPEPLASLIRRLPERRQTGPSGHAPADHVWLFPSRNANQPLHPETLSAHMRRLGVRTRAYRTAALLQLATELPPIVIADMLGLHPSTAVKWAKAAGGDWTRYAARRARTT